ncbi:MAG: class I SAM-dependent methyltransferase [Rhizobacter sp.]
MSILTRSFNFVGMAYVQFRCRREYAKQTYVGLNERAIELAFLFKHIIGIAPQKVLDVGTGITALPQVLRTCGYLVTSIDNVKDYWPAGMVNRHYHVIDDDILQTAIKETFDLITCISVLEHISDHRRAVASMYKLLNKGGHLVLTCPYTEHTYVHNVYALPESSVAGNLPGFVTQSFSRNELSAWLEDTGFEIVDQEHWNFFSGAFWTCGKKIIPPLKSSAQASHQLTCLLLRKK